MNNKVIPLEKYDCKKAQASLEFVLIFLATLIFLTILISSMSFALTRAKSQSKIMEETMKMEEFTRLLEVYVNNGVAMYFTTSTTYNVSGNSVSTSYGNKSIVINGVIEKPRWFDAEPV